MKNPLTAIGSYLTNNLMALDQWANVAIFFGSPDETISARSYRRAQEGSKPWGYFRKAIDTLFHFDDNHTEEAYQNELSRAHLPKEYQVGLPFDELQQHQCDYSTALEAVKQELPALKADDWKGI